jgi:ribosomal protein S18 acetylase RimI-like enzyme
MTRIRHKMTIDTSIRISSGDWQTYPITSADFSQLGALMYDAYAGTIDDEGETLEQAEQVIKGTLEGKYGPFLHSSSFCISQDNKIVSATILALWQDKPFLAFAITHPAYQGRGMARHLIEKSITALAQEGKPELRLVVTEGNAHAQRLYESIGFKLLPIC